MLRINPTQKTAFEILSLRCSLAVGPHPHSPVLQLNFGNTYKE
jgi:hypothetical protein